MNVLHVVVPHTVASLNVTCALLNVISPLFNAFVFTHTASVHVNTILHVAPLFKFVLLGVHHVHTGTVISTLTLLLALVAAFVFHAASLTLLAANANVVVPSAFAVYLNVYIFPFVVSVTTAASTVTTLVVYVNALAAKLVVLIALHVDVHVNATLHV